MRELSLHILDLVQNSLTAGAQLIEINVEEDLDLDQLEITIRDDGQGMSPEMVDRALDPFVTTKTTRRVGLGLPLFAQHAEQCGGELTIGSSLGSGTTVRARFRRSHIDRVPLGNLVDTVTMLVMCNPERDFVFRHRLGDKENHLSTVEMREALGSDLPINSPEVLKWLQGYLEQGEARLHGGGEA
ncbi:MAG: ATP-binding protein [Bacillota bacterium]